MKFDIEEALALLELGDDISQQLHAAVVAIGAATEADLVVENMQFVEPNIVVTCSGIHIVCTPKHEMLTSDPKLFDAFEDVANETKISVKEAAAEAAEAAEAAAAEAAVLESPVDAIFEVAPVVRR